MKVSVIGAGAIGSVVAAYLAKAGADITLIGKPSQVEMIQRDGLTVRGIRGEEVFRLKALTRLDQYYDLNIFTVKTQDLEDAYQANHEFLDKGWILTSQNGVQADNILSVHFDREKMLSSIVMFGATYAQSGEVLFNFEGDWIIGKPFFPVDQSTHEIAGLLGKAFKTVVSNNIIGMKWLKVFVNFNNCICAVLGTSMQETFSDMDCCRLSVALLREGVAVIQKAGIELVSLPQFPVDRVFGLAAMPEGQAAGIINKTLTGLSKEPVYGSILQSIMRGRSSEIDFINGEIVSIGRQIHVAVPLNEKIVDLVHKVEQSGKFLAVDQLKQELNFV
ncbi:MAG TPA: 2-dehydropantoate 2-reductase [Candidatus Omnitrophota bacterium]|nr:2-dehydropantoate 2-reductase [Candidatus Omnitrophota bacterium]